MPLSDVQIVFQWWSVLFLVGVAAFPLTKKLFSGWPATPKHDILSGEGWFDQGYLFSKAVGMAVIAYIVYFLGTLHIVPFSGYSITGALVALFLFGIFISIYNSQFPIFKQISTLKIENLRKKKWKFIVLYFVEEIFFLAALMSWSWVKAHEPSIQGLEKFMDYGFIQSILNTTWFPASDMWWAGGSINYYYFGHLVTAVLTKLSGLDLAVTFNLMLTTIFALTLTMSFSIGVQLQHVLHLYVDQKAPSIKHQISNKFQYLNLKHFGFLNLEFVWNLKFVICDLCAGILTAFLVTLAGNMQTLYAFTKGYLGDNVVPFWTILWPLNEFWTHAGEGIDRYWYANATRFIPFSIHEFPSYSFVVSDIHGHVLSLPFVLLAIALLIQLVNYELRITNYLKNQSVIRYPLLINYIFYGFLLAVLLMTNAFDGPIYFGLFLFVIAVSYGFWKKMLVPLGIVIIVMVITALPFLTHFSSFANGIGVNCPPAFLANTRIGPFIFEGVEKCQKSPLWMMWLLWGFFWYTGIWLFVKKIWTKAQWDSPTLRILKVFFCYALFLIIVPEFFYAKDIYPAHFRSNTMFKLGYQAFILWSIVAAYVIIHFSFQRLPPQIPNSKLQITNKFKIFNYKTLRIIFFFLLIPQLFLVSIYPIFSVRSYFGELRTYKSIDGLAWLREAYPDDWGAIVWLKNQLRITNYELRKKTDINLQLPVIVEADGDSYTDYNHVSAFSGIPTIIGWSVHEWLWRGSYDIVAPRKEDVRRIYESPDPQEMKELLSRYNVRYILVGKLERTKFTGLQEKNIQSLTIPVFQSGDTVVYEVMME